MKVMRHVAGLGLAFCLAVAASIAGFAQQVRIQVIGGPLVGPLPFLTNG